jgi:hypothetical protein
MPLRDEAAHQKTEQRFNGIEPGSVREKRLATGRDGPSNHDERNPDVGSQLLADEPRRQLRREERDQEDLFWQHKQSGSGF